MIRRHLQPNNSTAYERALSETMDRSPELSPAIAALRGFKFRPPDHIVPYLVVEYALTEIEDYLPDLRTVLAEGILWQRLRGTPAALHRALGWIGHDGTLEESPPTRVKWWWFQVHLPFEVRSSEFERPMTALVKASKPLRSEFARITAGYDVRGLRLNAGRLNSNLLNSWSGVRRQAGEPVLSLRVNHRNEVTYSDFGIGIIPGASTIHHVHVVDAAAPTEQRSGFPSALATSIADASKPNSVPFNNSPFSSDDPFGVPAQIAQTGF
jgi:P2-related tail formation protein